MTAGQRRGGYCAWHKGTAEDVVMVSAIEGGSGAGWPLNACLDCARELVNSRNAPPSLKTEVAAMEKRTAAARRHAS